MYSLPGSMPCIDNCSDRIAGFNVFLGSYQFTDIYAIPNPSSGETKFEFFIPSEYSSAEIVIYDLNGSIVKTVKVSSGDKTITVSLTDLSAGMYFYALELPTKARTIKKIIKIN